MTELLQQSEPRSEGARLPFLTAPTHVNLQQLMRPEMVHEVLDFIKSEGIIGPDSILNGNALDYKTGIDGRAIPYAVLLIKPIGDKHLNKHTSYHFVQEDGKWLLEQIDDKTSRNIGSGVALRSTRMTLTADTANVFESRVFDLPAEDQSGNRTNILMRLQEDFTADSTAVHYFVSAGIREDKKILDIDITRQSQTLLFAQGTNRIQLAINGLKLLDVVESDPTIREAFYASTIFEPEDLSERNRCHRALEMQTSELFRRTRSNTLLKRTITATLPGLTTFRG